MGNGIHPVSFLVSIHLLKIAELRKEGFLTLSRHCELDESGELDESIKSGDLDELGESGNCCKVEDQRFPLSPQGGEFVC